jgi:hypothetical protein
VIKEKKESFGMKRESIVIYIGHSLCQDSVAMGYIDRVLEKRAVFARRRYYYGTHDDSLPQELLEIEHLQLIKLQKYIQPQT